MNKNLLPVKQKNSNQKSACEKRGRNKSETWFKKWAWKKNCPWKIEKMLKVALTDTFLYSRGKRRCPKVPKISPQIKPTNSPPTTQIKPRFIAGEKLQ